MWTKGRWLACGWRVLGSIEAVRICSTACTTPCGTSAPRTDLDGDAWHIAVAERVADYGTAGIDLLKQGAQGRQIAIPRQAHGSETNITIDGDQFATPAMRIADGAITEVSHEHEPQKQSNRRE